MGTEMLPLRCAQGFGSCAHHDNVEDHQDLISYVSGQIQFSAVSSCLYQHGMIGLCNDITEEKPGRKYKLLVDIDDDTSDLSEEVGSDELLSDDNLRLPESANILVRLHAVRAWLARRREEAIIEVGKAALEFQQAATPGPQETRLRRRERQGYEARLRDTQRVLAAAQQRLQAYEDAQTLLEDCIAHTTSGERVLVEYYLTLEELVQSSTQGSEEERTPRLRALSDVQHRIERVGTPNEEE
jgi:hypothetical protein